MLTKEQKREQSDQLEMHLSDVSTLFLLENTGLNVNDVNVLRVRDTKDRRHLQGRQELGREACGGGHRSRGASHLT